MCNRVSGFGVTAHRLLKAPPPLLRQIGQTIQLGRFDESKTDEANEGRAGSGWGGTAAGAGQGLLSAEDLPDGVTDTQLVPVGPGGPALAFYEERFTQVRPHV